MQNPEYRTAAWEAADDYHITGYAVVFDSRTVLYKDEETGLEYGECIKEGALDCADMSDVVLRFNHAGRVLARTRNGSLKLNTDSQGLKIDADLSGSDEARKTYEEVKNGLLDKMSFAFTVGPGGESWNPKTRTRSISRIGRLYDVSVVDFPAYEQTSVQARSYFEILSSDDREEYNERRVSGMVDEIDKYAQSVGATEEEPENYVDRSAYPIVGHEVEVGDVGGVIAVRNKIAKLRCSVLNKKSANDVGYVTDAYNQLEALKIELQEAQERKRKEYEEMPCEVICTFDEFGGAHWCGDFNKRKDEHNMEDTMNFYTKLAEARAAAGTSGMSNVIPTEIIEAKYRNGKNGFMPFINETHIANGGSVKIPYVGDDEVTISAHTENASITPNNLVPAVLTITHGELQETLGYSYLGMQVAEYELKNIVENALLNAMELKLDAVALAAVTGLTWVKASGTTQNAVQWAASGAPTLDELITLMGLLKAKYTQGAKFFMNQKTSLAIIKKATGTAYKASDDSAATNGMYNVNVVDGLTRLFGVDVVIDSNMSDGDVLYGAGNAVHMNYAGNVELNNWMDRDSLTEKFQVACAVGAACEPAGFVRGANSIS